MSTLINAGGTTLPFPADPRDDPWRQMLGWQRDGAALCFVYARSLGGLMQTGRGQLARLAPDALTLEAGPCKLLVMLAGAAYETGPQLFFTPDLLSRFDVDGVAVRLANHDWLFLTASALPAHLAIGAA
ncbi:hypothetical protein [Rugamonas sp.]|uniref:hypothetical protein n=1 Tax=Rugamonas sp. TaxID=1926287 RepID=UPI0025DDF0CB|nr:hypothetical protein [Rugamonas sp.]